MTMLLVQTSFSKIRVKTLMMVMLNTLSIPRIKKMTFSKISMINKSQYIL